jgi:hypothetical protein
VMGRAGQMPTPGKKKSAQNPFLQQPERRPRAAPAFHKRFSTKIQGAAIWACHHFIQHG